MKKETKVVVAVVVLIAVILGLAIWFYLIPQLNKKNQKPIKLSENQKLSATLLKMSESYFKESELYDTDNLSFLRIDSIQYLGKKDSILTYYVVFKAKCSKKTDRACLYFPVEDEIDYTKKFDYAGFLQIKEENGLYTLVQFDGVSGSTIDSIFPEDTVLKIFESSMKAQYEFTLFQVESVKFLKLAKQPIYEIKGTYQCKDLNNRCISNGTGNNFDYVVGMKKDDNKVIVDFVDSTTNYEIIK